MDGRVIVRYDVLLGHVFSSFRRLLKLKFLFESSIAGCDLTLKWSLRAMLFWAAGAIRATEKRKRYPGLWCHHLPESALSTHEYFLLKKLYEVVN